MQGSQLRTYSIGLAAENKPLDSRMLNVVPVEKLPALDGELTFNPQENIAKGTDSQGNQYEVKTTTDITLTAEWLPRGSNRATPPDIRRGEYVEILQLGDSDRFFWCELGLRDDLRRLETVIYVFNANPNEAGNGLDINNCYFLEISTHQKLVTFGTSKANGEPFGYTLQLNTDVGQLTVQDDIGNFLHMDSKRRFIHAENADRSYVEIDKRKIHAQNTAGTLLDMDDDHLRLQNATGSFVDLNAANIEISADAGVTMRSGASVFTLAPDGTILKSPKFKGSE